MDLFSREQKHRHIPLAARMRPRTLETYVGQDHIVGPGRLLRRVIQADQLTSVLFYGPPGTGKTTLARVIANTTSSAFITLNAVLSGVKQLREAIDQARETHDLYNRKTILFIDEVHRWNKAQQDALLPWVENGTVILIGATTENPFFEVNSALVSRSRVFQLKPLNDDDMRAIYRQTVEDKQNGYGRFSVIMEEAALDHLVQVADGDARSLLNALELAVETSVLPFPPEPGTEIRIDLKTAEESIQQKAVLYDKEGDYHFDTISAFIKSIRGSDPDAALYWMAVMVRAGESPRYIFRRMLISASEDIGLADPAALGLVESAAAAFDRVGLPEGRFHLAQAALYLATAPKSNSTLGFFDALESLEQEKRREIPNHLRDANRDAEGFGHGEGYLYPHAYRDHWVAQQYLPEAIRGKAFYTPSDQGYEGLVRDQVFRRREAQLAAGFHAGDPEILTFSPPDRGRDQWLNRVTENRGAVLRTVSETLRNRHAPQRHQRVSVLNAGDGLLLWEALRAAPEGRITGIVHQEEEKTRLLQYARALETTEQPFVRLFDEIQTETPEAGEELFWGVNCFGNPDEWQRTLAFLERRLAIDGRYSFAQRVPLLGQRLSGFIENDTSVPPKLYQQLKDSEEYTYARLDDNRLNWKPESLIERIEAGALPPCDSELILYRETRRITAEQVQRWLVPDVEAHSYAALLSGQFSKEEWHTVSLALDRALTDKSVSWKIAVLYLFSRSE